MFIDFFRKFTIRKWRISFYIYAGKVRAGGRAIPGIGF